jgi:hypothetical protein
MRYTFSMRDLLIILGVIFTTLLVGGLLLFYNPASFHLNFGSHLAPAAAFRLLKEGTDANSMDERANYEITDGSQLNQLWGYLGATPGTVPNIDFTKEEVLAVFDGTHTTGGYRITVTDITEASGTRTVHVSRIAPGANCAKANAITSPYQIIAVPKSTLPLAHVDTSVTQDCP